MPPPYPQARRRVGLSRSALSRTTGNQTRLSLPISSLNSRNVANPPQSSPSTCNAKETRKLLHSIPKKPVRAHYPEPNPNNDKQRLYFSVLYTKRSKKKHKSYLDGFIIVTNDRHVQLQNDDGKKVSAERVGKLGGLKSGNTLELGSWQLEVQEEVKEEDYISGRLYIKSQPPTTISRRTSTLRKPFKPLKPKTLNRAMSSSVHGPLYNPNAPNAFVLSPPPKPHETNAIAVVLDPYLAKKMRTHQKSGLKFLYQCVQGTHPMSREGSQGAILADEMGLGKSLQAIALIWTLLKQGPQGAPLVKKAIVVCPASLVSNWANEVKKWLGNERLVPVAAESGNSTFESKQGLAAFVNGNVKKLLIISYEMFRSNAENLYKSGCGLIICDEGHRLKSSQGNKTIEALKSLSCKRRVILTGTPVQNDLNEFFAVCDFVNPGCLGTLQTFRNVFAVPIISSKDSNANQSTIRIGEARAQELSRVTSAFVLRRTAGILERYLPPKIETVIFCRLVPEQEKKYEREARSRYLNIDTSKFSAALSAITCLRKICSHPILVEQDSDDAEDADEEDGLDVNEGALKNFDVSHSSKMRITMSICDACLAVGDKVILVSNYTSTLDLIQRCLSEKKVKYCRLDGSTNVSRRGDIVRQFNKGLLGTVFLLSAKAGGVGLNLIGANRLILFDPDWNPATDLQAMARVWRDGQKKAVFVYRLLCTGTIEEKIFQRQLFKGELQCAVDGNDVKSVKTGNVYGGKEGNFSAEQLKDLFQYHGELRFCDTYQVLERSQLGAKKAEETRDSEDEGGTKAIKRQSKDSLLERFKEYERSLERELGMEVEDLVLCGEDEVLNDALNGNLSTHGLVSYLYSKKYGSTFGDESGAKAKVNEGVKGESRPKDVLAGKSGGGKRKLSSLLETDFEDSSDEDVDKAMAAVRNARWKKNSEMRKKVQRVETKCGGLEGKSGEKDMMKPKLCVSGEQNKKDGWEAAMNDLTLDYEEL